MTIGEILIAIVMIIGFIIVGIVKRTPEYFLNRNLENFKNDLKKDLEEIRISKENLHPAKIEEYINFTKVYTKMMELNKLKNPKKQQEAQREIFDGLTRFGFSAILFGSDETVKKYVEIRKFSTLPPQELGENEKAKMLLLMSELIIMMRNDLGNEKSKVSTDDFLQIVVNDWGTNKESFREKASKAKKL